MRSSKIKRGSECGLDLEERFYLNGGRKKAKLECKGRNYVEGSFYKSEGNSNMFRD